ncbi:hypothetical protein EUTSA_v10027445mg [Eutrema salsugineum]|uniref:F-box domain-containing protein n=1 Tax=Eutrema salsugineum TaxID=72664 RepID=V4MJR6_EUTSA|nr:putative F-box protein At4g17565 [Eutrema salsugineum]ESQ55667.1 hypothetical protein EUTSA_v10027445mg [Eutrema salsugineum]
MDEIENKPNRPPMNPKWSELCQDLIRSVFERLSFTNLNRAKSVCRSWNSASRQCVPKRNQIPWLIIFPPENQTNINICDLFIPDDEDKVYKTRDLHVGFAQSSCLATYGSWLLMYDHLWNLYVLNPLTLERIDLPHSVSIIPKNFKGDMRSVPCYMRSKAYLWIDDITKDYLVIWTIHTKMFFIKKGDKKWRNCGLLGNCEQIVYNRNDHKFYITYSLTSQVTVWDFSGDIPHNDGDLLPFVPVWIEEVYWYRLRYCYMRTQIAITVSGQVLCVVCIFLQGCEWLFPIFKLDPLRQRWVRIDSLGDEALILDMGLTVVAQDVPGIKKNSIYFSGLDHLSKDPNLVFVYDLTTKTKETLPHCVSSSIGFSHARWFFPDYTG